MTEIIGNFDVAEIFYPTEAGAKLAYLIVIGCLSWCFFVRR